MYRDSGHVNSYGHIAMYRNVDLTIFARLSAKGGCAAVAPFSYLAVGASGGACSLPAGPVSFLTHSGDRCTGTGAS